MTRFLVARGMTRSRVGQGNDNIEGCKDDDCLWGESGLDTISGSLGKDLIRGGSDNDVLTGDRDYWDGSLSLDGRYVITDPDGLGLGKSRYRDVFYFEKNAAANGRDRIQDLDVIAGGKDVYGLNWRDADARYEKLDLTAALGSRLVFFSMWRTS